MQIFQFTKWNCIFWQLSRTFIENTKDSEVVKAQLEADYNMFTGRFSSSSGNQMMQSSFKYKDNILATLGAVKFHMITVPKGLYNKGWSSILLDAWNEGKEKGDMIIYNDMASAIVSLSWNNGSNMVLIAFMLYLY